MAAAGSTLPSDDQSTPTGSEDPILSTQNHWSATNNNNSLPPRPGQHLDGLYLLLRIFLQNNRFNIFQMLIYLLGNDSMQILV